MYKVFGINCTIHCRRGLRLATGRDSEIVPTGCLCSFAKNFTHPRFPLSLHGSWISANLSNKCREFFSGIFHPKGISKEMLWDYVKSKFDVEKRKDMTELQWTQLSAAFKERCRTHCPKGQRDGLPFSIVEESVAYYKLTDALIKVFKSALKPECKQYWIDLKCYATFSICIGDVCKKAGISRMTYYRWMRAYRALSGKRGRTETEKRLRAFGRAVDEAFATLATLNSQSEKKKELLLSGMPLMSFSKSVDTPFVDSTSSVGSVPTELGISEWEQMTDELTGGVRCVEFAVKDSLKNM